MLVRMKFIAGLTSVGLKGLGELVDGWGNSQTLLQDALLALHHDVAGPLGEAGQVTLGLNVTSNIEVPSLGLPDLQ
jgi:hypothetical protein